MNAGRKRKIICFRRAIMSLQKRKSVMRLRRADLKKKGNSFLRFLRRVGGLMKNVLHSQDVITLMTQLPVI